MTILDHIIEAGFKYTDNLVHAFVGGSELHGAKVHGTDDLDIYGLYIESPDQIVGLFPDEHFVWSSSGPHTRNTAADVDITLYGLRKWSAMALKGNPSALHYLFAPNRLTRLTWWDSMREDIKACVISKSAVHQFKGFADNQMGRLLGTRGRGKKGQRPELEITFGYDVKAGMHAIRLLNEAIELMSTGRITLPRPEREFLIRIRSGGLSLDRLANHANTLFKELDDAVATSPLPEKPDKQKLSSLVSQTYLKFWDQPKFCTTNRATAG